jgi:hypothetical protein
MAFTRPELEQFASRHMGDFERLLSELVEIPGVPADPARKGELERTADLEAEVARH